MERKETERWMGEGSLRIDCRTVKTSKANGTIARSAEKGYGVEDTGWLRKIAFWPLPSCFAA